MYCPATIAPPAASAANTCSSSTFTQSTSDTADTAASPTVDTISESSRPTVQLSICSISNGTIRRRKSRLENVISFFSCSPTVFPFSIATNLYYFLYYTPF